MVSRYALVRDGIVDNVVMWDGDESTWAPPDDMVCVRLDDDTACSTGDHYDGNSFTAPETGEAELSVQVTVDPDALASARIVVTKATTVAGMRTALLGLIDLLAPEA